MAEDPAEPLVADTPRDVLRLFDFGTSEWSYFQDGRALEAGEFEPTYRLLDLLPRLDEVQRHRWRTVPTDWSRLEADPDSARGELFSVAGHVRTRTTILLPPETARRFRYDRIYQLDVQSLIDGRPLVVYARHLPAAWLAGDHIPPLEGWPIRCDGLFLKRGADVGEQASLVFATDRIGWYPDRVDTHLGVSAGAALLGSVGMDLSRLDSLDQGRPLGNADREAFYQLLWSVRRFDPQRLATSPPVAAFDVVAALQEPQRLAGQRSRIRGLARRAILIRVADPDIQERFGIDHYYEVELFMPLPQPLKLRDPRDGRELEYQNFPVTFCAMELPREMPLGDEIRQLVDVDAFFFKVWSYRSRFTSGTESEAASTVPRRQLAPLLIAANVQLPQPTTTRNPWPVAVLCLVVFGGVAAALAARWWYAPADQQFALAP